MEDVARLAGVSSATVSRALRAPQKVAPHTVARIHAVIDQLGYVGNELAGALATRRSRVVGVVAPRIGAPVAAEVVRGMASILEPAGYALMLGTSEESILKEQSLVAAFLARRVDGICLINTLHTAETRMMLSAAGIPVLEAGALPESPLEMVSGFDNRAGASVMTSHLIDRGCKRLVFVGPPAHGNARSEQRRRGFQDAVRERSGDVVEVCIHDASAGIRAGAEAMRYLLATEDFDAILFGSGLSACGAVFECMRQGRKVPRDVAIAGIEAEELASEMVPRLTTLSVPRFEMGRMAGRMLLSRMMGETVSRWFMTPASMFWREIPRENAWPSARPEDRSCLTLLDAASQVFRPGSCASAPRPAGSSSR